MTENTVQSSGAVSVDPAQSPEEAPRYAGFRTRMYACVIDLGLMVLLLSLLFSGQFGMDPSSIPPELAEGMQSLQADLEAGKVTGVEYLSQMNAMAIQARGGMGSILTDFVLQLIVLALYYIISWKYCRPTPGKRILKLGIVDAETLGEPTRKQLIIRFFGYVISSIPLALGFFWAIFDKKKQSWHDKMAHTVVIITAPYDPDWKKKQFKKQTILAFVLILGLLIYNRIIRQ